FGEKARSGGNTAWDVATLAAAARTLASHIRAQSGKVGLNSASVVLRSYRDLERRLRAAEAEIASMRQGPLPTDKEGKPEGITSEEITALARKWFPDREGGGMYAPQAGRARCEHALREALKIRGKS